MLFKLSIDPSEVAISKEQLLGHDLENDEELQDENMKNYRGLQGIISAKVNGDHMERLQPELSLSLHWNFLSIFRPCTFKYQKFKFVYPHSNILFEYTPAQSTNFNLD